VQRFLAVSLGEVGIAKIGQFRNLIQIVTSTASFGSFNGIVKYVSEFSDDKIKLRKVFNTVFALWFVGAIITSLIIYFNASWITKQLFGDLEFLNLIKLFALLPPIIGVSRIFQGVVNGLSEYKRYAKIDLIGYILSTLLLLACLYVGSLKGVLFSIILSPIIQLLVIIYVLNPIFKKYIEITKLKFKIPFAREFLGFALMSFVSSILLNYVEIDIRNSIAGKLSFDEAGYWTSMNFISKNCMSFSSGIFSLYVIPKFSRIYSGKDFKKEVLYIYKTLLPLFGIGMIAVYLVRKTIIDVVYPNFYGMEPLFKWQLLGDFIRLAAIVIAHQFLAKKMVKSFIATEILSLGLFYLLSKYLIHIYGVEGVVMAHFYRYIIYFFVVLIIVCFCFVVPKSKKS